MNYSTAQNHTRRQDIGLSYVLSTRNKLPRLRQVMERLLAQVREDEEIVVIDGGSTDGTREYLSELKGSGKIQRFLSEPDKGEAHGFNKGFFLARGEVIKVLSDDDSFHWPSIRACKEFMLAHPEVDLLFTNGASLEKLDTTEVLRFDYRRQFDTWMTRSRPFDFCGLGLMMRRSSLPLLGLFNTGFMRIDNEYSLRTTSAPINLALYSGCTFVRILNPQSNTVTQEDRFVSERVRLDQFYFGHTAPESPPCPCQQKQTLLQRIKAPLRPVKRGLGRVVRAARGGGRRRTTAVPEAPAPMPDTSFLIPDRPHFVPDSLCLVPLCDEWLRRENQEHPGEFSFKGAEVKAGRS